MIKGSTTWSNASANWLGGNFGLTQGSAPPIRGRRERKAAGRPALAQACARVTSGMPGNGQLWGFSVSEASHQVRTYRPSRVNWPSEGRGDRRADIWIRRTTTGCVALLALIAGTVSYLHMHRLVALHGQPGWGRFAHTAVGGRDDRGRVHGVASQPVMPGAVPRTGRCMYERHKGSRMRLRQDARRRSGPSGQDSTWASLTPDKYRRISALSSKQAGRGNRARPVARARPGWHPSARLLPGHPDCARPPAASSVPREGLSYGLATFRDNHISGHAQVTAAIHVSCSTSEPSEVRPELVDLSVSQLIGDFRSCLSLQ